MLLRGLVMEVDTEENKHLLLRYSQWQCCEGKKILLTSMTT